MAPRRGSIGGVSFADDVLRWYDGAARDLPWRRTDAGAWAVLVSEIMLQQTPVARVLPAYEAWLDRWPTPAALAAEPRGEAVRMWGRLGYPRRALRLHECAVTVVARHGGRVPADLDVLLALPGVGPYTARAVATFAHGRRHAVVDTNVRRVVTRAVRGHALPGSATGDLALVEPLVPASAPAAARFAAAVMELGALVCTARAPRCGECPVAAQCDWRLAGYPEALEARPPSQRYDGTDRQARGRLLAVLRAAEGPVRAAALDVAWAEPGQRARALDTLVSDGLVDPMPEGTYALPT